MANEIQSYSGPGGTGQYKDIIDKLFYINANDRHVSRMSGQTVAKGKTHYWESVSYPNHTATDARIEAADLTNDVPPTQTEYSNLTEINSETYAVSTTQQAVAKRGGAAGVRSYLKRMATEALTVLMDKVEYAMVTSQAATGGAASIRKMDGLVKMATAYGASGFVGGADLAASGESDFLTFTQTLRDAGGMKGSDLVAMMAYTTKQTIISNWTGNVTDVNVMADKGVIWNDAKVYQTQFGPIKLMGHDAFSASDLVVFNKKDLNTAVLEKTTSKFLADVGLARRYTIYNEVTLQYNNPGTLGYFNIT